MKQVDRIIQLDQPGAPVAVVEETIKAGTYRTRKIDLLERWHRAGKIETRHWTAGQQFSQDFYKAGLTDRYSTQNFDRIDGGSRDHTPHAVIDARDRVRQAIYATGMRGGSIAWDVLGNGDSLSIYCRNHDWTGGNVHFATGLLIGALDCLAHHYRC
jgi:hypothetical protein